MADTDLVLLEALLDDVLDPTIVTDSIEFAIGVLRGDDAGDRRDDVEQALGEIERERRQLLAAISSGRAVTGLLDVLQALDDRQAGLDSQRAAIASRQRLRASDAATLRRELTTLAGSWRKVLADDPIHARPIVTTLLNGRVTITPTATRKEWALTGEGTLTGLFQRSIFQAVWRPHRDSNPGFSLERAAS